jgi:hypothetical protein
MSERLEQMAVITLIRYKDGEQSCIITSHPDGCDMEQMAKLVIETMNAMIVAAKEKP